MNKNTRILVTVALGMAWIYLLIDFIFRVSKYPLFDIFQIWYVLSIVGIGVLVYSSYKKLKFS